MKETEEPRVAHVYPAHAEIEHELSGFCWCQPTYEDTPDGGRIFIHRRTLDSPHIEREVGTEP